MVDTCRKPLLEVCDLLDSKRVPVTSNKRIHGPYPYYGANVIQDYVNDYIFDDDLVLLAEDGGNFGSKDKPIAYRVSGKCWVNNHAHVLKPREGLNVDYLCYSLMYYDTKGLVNGATRKKLTQAAMKNIKIPILAYNEQLKIVKRIAVVSTLIKNKKKELGLLDEFVKSRFLELFGDPNDVSILSLPGEKKSIEDVCDGIYGGGTPSKSHKEYYTGKIPWVTPKDMKTLSIDDSQNHINSEAIENSTAKLIPKRCVLMVIRSGILKHTLPVAINNVEVTINQDMKAFVPSSLITPEYLLYTFKLMEKSILSKVRGVTADNIEFSEFRKRRIVVPPIEVQTQFVDFALSIDKSKYREAIFLYLLEDIRICCNI